MKAHKVDNLIVGGGLSGWSLAYWLKQFRPNQSTMVLHSSLPKLSPASVRNAGFLTVGSLNFYMQNREEQGDHFAQEILHFCKDNHAVLKAEGLLGKCPSYIHNGSYSITSLEIESPPRQFERVSDFNLPTAIGESVWHCAFDGSVDPEQLMRALKQKAGAMSQDTEVTHVDHNRVESVSAEFQAEKVFVATNAWTNWLLQQPKVHPLERKPFAQARWLRGKSPTTIFLMNWLTCEFAKTAGLWLAECAA
jgi:glycine/D-amino acid oxidase-like deaminating enzyme